MNKEQFDWKIVERVGLTKQEYFAGIALSGLLSNPNVDLEVSPMYVKDLEEFKQFKAAKIEKLAKTSLKLADALTAVITASNENENQ